MEKEIKVSSGTKLESVVYALLAAKEIGKHVCCDFNGVILHSDTVSMDSAFMEVVGCTKAEYDQLQKEWQENYEREQKIAEQKAKESIPSWIEKGQALISQERYEEWEKCVQARATDIYHGYELDAALEIMTALENGATLEEAKQILDKQGHTGRSASMVRNILFSFSSKDPEFWETTAYGEISAENNQLIEVKKTKKYSISTK